MIVATAGHIDHGKTTLVRALTGVDTDRLPEEKARGISIDLGFAYRPTADGGIRGLEHAGLPGGFALGGRVHALGGEHAGLRRRSIGGSRELRQELLDERKRRG